MKLHFNSQNTPSRRGAQLKKAEGYKSNQSNIFWSTYGVCSLNTANVSLLTDNTGNQKVMQPNADTILIIIKVQITVLIREWEASVVCVWVEGN
jgi:hypothetical protein